MRGNVEDGVRESLDALERLSNQIYAEYAEPDADFDKLAAEQGKWKTSLSLGTPTTLTPS